MKLNKFVCVVIAIFMLVSMFAVGCSSNQDEPSTTPEKEPEQQSDPETEPGTDAPEPITFSVFFASSREDYPGGSRVGDIITAETGVTLEREYLVGDLETKLGVMIAGGDYPDFMDGGHENGMFHEAGAFIPITDLIEEHGPNIKALYGDWLDRLKKDDGHIYTLAPWVPTGEQLLGSYTGPAVGLQKAVLIEFGYPEIKTFDQWMDLIERYAEKYPEIDGQPTIGYLPLFDGWRSFAVKNAPYHLAGYPNDGAGIVDWVDDTWVVDIHWNKPMTYDFLKALNTMYHKGLLDPEGFVGDYDSYLEKISSGRVLGVIDQFWQIGDAQNVLNSEKPERAMAPLPIVFDESITDELLEFPSLQVENGVGISIHNPDPVRAIQFIDYLCREETQKLLQWGVEGVDYYVEDGRFLRTPEVREKAKDALTWNKEHGGAYFHGFPIARGSYSCGNATSPDRQPEERFADMNDVDRELLSAYGVMTYEEKFTFPEKERVYFPLWSMNLETGSVAETTSVRLDELTTRYIPLLVLSDADKFDAMWDEFQAELGKLDLDAYIAGYQEMVDQRVQEWQPVRLQ